MPRQSHFTICAVCAGPGTGVCFAPQQRMGEPFRPLSLCGDLDCLSTARNTFSMKQHEFDRIEMMATLEAGHALEKFCDVIGKTDFREFSQSEFETAMKCVISEYRDALKGKLRDEAPF